MDDNNHEWDQLASCQITGTTTALADQIANLAQGDDQGIHITLRAQNDKIRLDVLNGSPIEYKDYATSAKRMLDRAGINDVDVSVRLETSAAQRVLERLNNRDEANIHVAFK